MSSSVVTAQSRADDPGDWERAGTSGRAAHVFALALALVAVGISSYLTYTHFTDPSALACPDHGAINCTLVTTSSWSRILGVPVAAIGLAWALAMTALTLPHAWRSSRPSVHAARVVLAAAGGAMVLYLVYVELFRIGAICLWCTGVHVAAVALLAVVLLARSSVREPDVGEVVE